MHITSLCLCLHAGISYLFYTQLTCSLSLRWMTLAAESCLLVFPEILQKAAGIDCSHLNTCRKRNVLEKLHVDILPQGEQTCKGCL